MQAKTSKKAEPGWQRQARADRKRNLGKQEGRQAGRGTCVKFCG
jgi:hypothetical protein